MRIRVTKPSWPSRMVVIPSKIESQSFDAVLVCNNVAVRFPHQLDEFLIVIFIHFYLRYLRVQSIECRSQHPTPGSGPIDRANIIHGDLQCTIWVVNWKFSTILNTRYNVPGIPLLYLLDIINDINEDI